MTKIQNILKLNTDSQLKFLKLIKRNWQNVCVCFCVCVFTYYNFIAITH